VIMAIVGQLITSHYLISPIEASFTQHLTFKLAVTFQVSSQMDDFRGRLLLTVRNEQKPCEQCPGIRRGIRRSLHVVFPPNATI